MIILSNGMKLHLNIFTHLKYVINDEEKVIDLTQLDSEKLTNLFLLISQYTAFVLHNYSIKEHAVVYTRNIQAIRLFD